MRCPAIPIAKAFSSEACVRITPLSFFVDFFNQLFELLFAQEVVADLFRVSSDFAEVLTGRGGVWGRLPTSVALARDLV